jgi:hypothetical protein
LVTGKNVVKIGDFGLARDLRRNRFHRHHSLLSISRDTSPRRELWLPRRHLEPCLRLLRDGDRPDAVSAVERQ